MTDLHALVAAFVDEHPSPALAWGIVRDSALTDVGGQGDVTEHTVFRIASMTKCFSAAATLLLRDEGVLRLDDPVRDHAPELDALTDGWADAAPITVRDLLTMSSGLPTDDPWADRHLDLTDDEFDRIIADGPLFAAATGTGFEYSNFGFAVLGRVVHRATGVRIQQVISDRLLAPLGMDRTTWVRPPHDDWARPTRRVDGTDVAEADPLGDGLIAPMGGLWTSVSDLARWVAWLDDAFPARDDRDDGPLRRSSRRELQQPMRYIGHRTLRGVRSPSSYGYGVRLLDEPTLGTVATHSGGLPGYGSNMRWLPGRGVGAIALANTTYAPMTELTARLLDAAVENAAPVDRTAIDADLLEHAAGRLVSLLNDWSDADAEQLVTQSLNADDSLSIRAASAHRLIEEVGLLTVESIDAATAARGTIRARGASGAAVDISLMLAPRRPASVQHYECTRRPAG